VVDPRRIRQAALDLLANAGEPGGRADAQAPIAPSV